MIYMYDNCSGINYFFGDRHDLEETLCVIFDLGAEGVSDAINYIVSNVGRDCISEQCAFLNIEITLA